MGLSSYGKNNPKIPIIFPDNLSDLNIVYEYIDNKSNRNRRVNIDISCILQAKSFSKSVILEGSLCQL